MYVRNATVASGDEPRLTALRQFAAFPGYDLAARWIAGMMLFQTAVWAFIVVATTGGGGEEIGTPYHVCFFLAFTFVCGVAALVANRVMRARTPERRGPVVWGLWGVLFVAYLATLPAQGALIESKKWPSVGIVTASVGMTFADVQRGSTAKLRDRSGTIEPKLRFNDVASLRLASTPTTFARCWSLSITTGTDERTNEIVARILSGEVPRADVDRVLAAASAQLAADGWTGTGTPGVFTRSGMRLALEAHRTNPTGDDDVTPQYTAIVDVTSAAAPASSALPARDPLALPLSLSRPAFGSGGAPFRHFRHHFSHHHFSHHH